jgi:hypothetical protein
MSTELGESIHFRPSKPIAEKVREMARNEKCRQSEIIRRVLESYFNNEEKMVSITIHSQLGSAEELSLALGLLHDTREHWRNVGSRINSPRSISPDDEESMTEWRKQKEQVAAYFRACEDMKKRLEALSVFYSGFTANDYDNLKKLGAQTTQAKASLEHKKAAEVDADRIRSLDANLVYFETILKWLRDMGVIDVL